METEHSIQFDNSPLDLKKIAFYIGFTFVFLAFVLGLSLMIFSGAMTEHKRQKEKTPPSYELESLRLYETGQLKGIDKAIESVVRNYKK